MGIKYAMFSKALIINVATRTIWPASAAPRARYHLLQVPPQGGRPMMLMEARANAVKVQGMALPSPSSSLTCVLWAAT